MGLNPLGIVREFVEEAGMGIAYVYEDIVFIDHNAFLLQFTEDKKRILVHINQAANKTEIDDDIARLREKAMARDIELLDGDSYSISQEGDENIRLEFIESK
jgi:hypothetical protein